ncbi:hypothetical protein GCM10010174_03820 [Kutzneria viridogrisea]|uniref:Uncharacterized protein n=1 Tax=Kutzneria viridogrisea TaxID=47990 RepID=A0ABR6BRF2_9PSEU|nr:hypothetical protein [Kutzneria viridogrisea]
MDVEVLGHLGHRYYSRGARVLRDASPAQLAELVAEVCSVSGSDDPSWWTSLVVSRTDVPDGLELVVAPGTGYVALAWTGTQQRSLNPDPFTDAPLLARDGADDPPMYWRRNSYLPSGTAKAAVAQYLATGRQPSSVQWQTYGWDVHQLPDWLTAEMPEYEFFHLIEQ